MTIVLRYDTVALPKMSKTSDGFLKGKSPVTRAGVLPYMDTDGSTRYELRHPDDVFKADSINSLQMVPVTHEHPPFLLNADNIKSYQKGFTGEVCERIDNKLIVGMTITDPAIIQLITNKQKVELSAGYKCRLIREDGVYDGQKYTHRQVDIEYNHVSLVSQGRAGKEIAIRTDCNDTSTIPVAVSHNFINNPKSSDMSEETENLRFDAVQSKLDAQVKENELLKIKLDSAVKKSDLLEQSLNKMREELKQEKSARVDDAIEARARDRVQIIMTASQYLGDMDAYKAHSDRDIMIQTLKTDSKYSDANFSSMSLPEISGMFTVFTKQSVGYKADSKKLCVEFLEGSGAKRSQEQQKEIIAMMQGGK